MTASDPVTIVARETCRDSEHGVDWTGHPCGDCVDGAERLMAALRREGWRPTYYGRPADHERKAQDDE